MANLDLGRCDCPVCGADAPIRETKKGKAYITCTECGTQIFARGAGADANIRGRSKAKPAQPVTEQLGAADLGRAARVESAQPAPAPAVPAKEKTIFDIFG